LETSFCGSSFAKYGKKIEYTIKDFEQIGNDFCKALFLMYCEDFNVTKISIVEKIGLKEI